MSTGAELIAAERQRQIDEEGWTAGHDDQHTERELLRAAGVLLRLRRVDHWPWESTPPLSDDEIRDFAKAGALVAAEIDRLKRRAVRWAA